jgi:hypothetical protein
MQEQAVLTKPDARDCSCVNKGLLGCGTSRRMFIAVDVTVKVEVDSVSVMYTEMDVDVLVDVAVVVLVVVTGYLDEQ